MSDLPRRSDLSRYWMLDPDVVFLNHGSFGATPMVVFEEQERIRRHLESEPLRFFDRHYQQQIDESRAKLAAFVGTDPEGLAFVANATTGVNTVLRSLELDRGDEILVTDHEYNACRNAVDAVAGRFGATVVVAPVPFPLQGEDEVLEAVLDRVTPRTRLFLVDHVTSQTGMVLPIQRLVDEVQLSGVDVLVDGAHGPGMLDLDLEKIGAAYYTGNCHKWLCSPKGAAFLSVREDRRKGVRPLVISHGANAASGERSRFHLEHDWTGTRDPSAWLSVPAAIDFLDDVLDGGWPLVRKRNRELVLTGRRILCEALEIEPPCPDSMIGSMASLPLPDGDGEGSHEIFPFDVLQEKLFRDSAIEVPVIYWPERPQRLIRISAQLYNSEEEYAYLAQALKLLLT